MPTSPTTAPWVRTGALPFLGHALRMARDPLPLMLADADRHPDAVRFRMGPYRVTLVRHPDFVQRVLQSNATNYSKDTPIYQTAKIVLGRGLLTSDGDEWSRHRRIMQPAFQAAVVARFESIINDESEAFCSDTLLPAAAEHRTIDLQAAMMTLSLRVLGKAIFSADFSTFAHRLQPALEVLMKTILHKVYAPWSAPLWVPTAENRRFLAARRMIHDIVEQVIATIRQSPARQDNFVSLLLAARDEQGGGALTDDEVRDEVMMILLAGHETSGATLSWYWYLLSQHPDVASLVHDEACGQSADPVWIDSSLKETMRLYPAGWHVARRALADDVIHHLLIPAREIVIVSPYATHRAARFWAEPDSFDPRRFQGPPMDRFAFLPFGGGARVCIGNHFAMLSMRRMIATVARRFAFAAESRTPPIPEPLITLGMKGGCSVRVHTV